MYTLVRRFIKTGIGFLAVGLALGVYMLVRRELWGTWPHAGQAAGIGLYFWTMWSRIRPVGSHLREARGERF